jgi:hypothetical protein
MAMEVTPPMVARLLMHVRERLMQEIDHLKDTLPEDMERHTQKVFVGRTPTNLLQMVAERTKSENWQEKPTGDPLVRALAGLLRGQVVLEGDRGPVFGRGAHGARVPSGEAIRQGQREPRE